MILIVSIYRSLSFNGFVDSKKILNWMWMDNICNSELFFESGQIYILGPILSSSG